MLVCCKCRREMLCDKNLVGADFGHGHVYPADRFKCPDCGWCVLKTNPAPIHDPNHTSQEEYLTMSEYKQ